MNLADGVLKDITKLVVEKAEENPEPIAIITPEFIDVTDGYIVRMTPNYTKDKRKNENRLEKRNL